MHEGMMRTELTSMRPSSFEELDRTPYSLSGGDNADNKSPFVVDVAASHDEAERISDRVEEDDDDDDFEFTFEGIDRDSEWFPSGEVFPIFDRRLLSEPAATENENEKDQMRTVRSALKKLFIVDDDRSNNIITDESELNGIASQSYCVWTPGNSPQASPARCKKSSSTGTTSTKRWGVSSLKELLIRRSRSDGKKSLVRFGSWKKRESAVVVDAKIRSAAAAKGGGGKKRRATYLPYKKAIIGFGFYPSVNGFSSVNTTRPPF